MHRSHPRSAKTLALKFGVDLAMLLLIGVLYRASLVTLRVHMMAGLLLTGLVIVHAVVHRGVIARGVKGLKDRAGKADAIMVSALAVCFIAIIVSGILFAIPTIKGASVPAAAKAVHYWASAAAIVLAGVHVGLHLPMLSRAARSCFGISATVIKVLSATFLAIGLWSLFATDFLTWLFMPLEHVSTATATSALQSLLTGLQFVGLVTLFAAATHAVKHMLPKRAV
jgi:hypothetical protein